VYYAVYAEKSALIFNNNALVMKKVNIVDLKSTAARLAGSIPAQGTILKHIVSSRVWQP
jgi:hypothetical protein